MSIISEPDWMSQLKSGALWGDLQWDYDQLHPEEVEAQRQADAEKRAAVEAEKAAAEAAEQARYTNMSVEEYVLDGFVVPDLRLRRGIWENFCVNLIALPKGADGAERYSIVWDEERCNRCRSDEDLKARGIAPTWDDHTDFESWEEIRLFHALDQYKHKYKVEMARHAGEVCVLAMVFTPRLEETRVVPSGPRALDVLKRFPVVWAREGASHHIEVRGDKMMASFPASFREQSRRTRDEAIQAYKDKVKRDLLAALASCADCVVAAPPSDKYLCTVRLR